MAATAAAAPRRVVEETKRAFASLLAKPLDERQLARPTFKFIQEIVKSVFNANDFERPDAKVAWDKRRRADFVQRLLDFAASEKQPLVGCVAAKLVAGLEPVKCNELLQALARIAAGRQRAARHETQHVRPRTFTKPAAAENGAGGGPAARSRQPARRATGSGSPAASQQASRASSRQSSASGGRRASGQAPGSTSGSPAKSGHRGSSQLAKFEEVQPSRRLEEKRQAAGKEAPTEQAELGEAPTSESDPNKSLQLLRANLKAFQRFLADIDQLEGQLRVKLRQTIASAS